MCMYKKIWNWWFNPLFTKHTHGCISQFDCEINADNIYILSSLWYKRHLCRQWNWWSLGCRWSIACRRCSTYIFIHGLGKDNCKMKRKTFSFGDLVPLTLEVWRYMCMYKKIWNSWFNPLFTKHTHGSISQFDLQYPIWTPWHTGERRLQCKMTTATVMTVLNFPRFSSSIYVAIILITDSKHAKNCSQLFIIVTPMMDLKHQSNILQFYINSLRLSDVYMRQYTNHHWFR